MKVQFTTTVKARDGPSTWDTNSFFNKYSGDVVIATNVIEYDDRKWVEFNERGDTYYSCIEDENGSQYAKLLEGNNSNCSMLQKNSNYAAVRKEGCCFLWACYLGGLNDIDEADKCFAWAIKERKVRERDSYVNIDKYSLAKQIAEKYKRTQRDGNIVKGKGHFYVTDSNGNEIFNSIRPGYGH